MLCFVWYYWASEFYPTALWPFPIYPWNFQQCCPRGTIENPKASQSIYFFVLNSTPAPDIMPSGPSWPDGDFNRYEKWRVMAYPQGRWRFDCIRFSSPQSTIRKALTLYSSDQTHTLSSASIRSFFTLHSTSKTTRVRLHRSHHEACISRTRRVVLKYIQHFCASKLLCRFLHWAGPRLRIICRAIGADPSSE